MLTKKEQQIIRRIVEDMVEVIDNDTLNYILDEPYDSEDGIMANDAFFEQLINKDWNEVARYATTYLRSLV